MGCPACTTDYNGLETKIDAGQVRAEQQLIELVEQDMHIATNAVIVYCNSCQETIQRLHARIASRLRQETLVNIGNLLDQAYDKKHKKA